MRILARHAAGRGGLALAALLAAAPLTAADVGHLEARQLRAAGLILPLERIVAEARRHQPGSILETELEKERGRYVYEIELLDAHGRVWELKLDAASGRLLTREQED